MRNLVARLRRSLGFKSAYDVRKEVEAEPAVKRAKRAMELGESVLNELESVERRKRRK